MTSTRVGSWTIYRYDTVDSTQRVAADLVAAGTAHRTAVVANRQTAGYGRKGDAWQDAPDMSLLVTLILRPKDARHLPQLTMIAALAVIDAIAELSDARAVVKWPNDVFLNGRKVAGILGDATWRGSQVDAIRLGIGLNIGGDRASFSRRALPDATSIAAEVGRDLDRDAVLVALLSHVAARQDVLDRGGVEETVGAWRHALATLDQHVVVTLHDARVIRGVATNVTSDGDVIVMTDDGASFQLAAAETRSLRHVACAAKTERLGGSGL